MASTSGQRSPPEEPLREIIRFKARKLRGVCQLSLYLICVPCTCCNCMMHCNGVCCPPCLLTLSSVHADQKDILPSCASRPRKTGHLASQKVSPQQLPAARLLSCSSAPLLSPSAQHSYFSQVIRCNRIYKASCFTFWLIGAMPC